MQTIINNNILQASRKFFGEVEGAWEYFYRTKVVYYNWLYQQLNNNNDKGLAGLASLSPWQHHCHKSRVKNTLNHSDRGI